jgi:hypothetical protein
MGWLRKGWDFVAFCAGVLGNWGGFIHSYGAKGRGKRLESRPAFPIRQKLQILEELEEEEGRTARQEEMSRPERRWRPPGLRCRQGKP